MIDVSFQDFSEMALPEMIRFSKGEDLPEGFVPETFLFLWDDGTIVGEKDGRYFVRIVNPGKGLRPRE